MRYIVPAIAYLLLLCAVWSRCAELINAPSDGQVWLGVALALAFVHVSVAGFCLLRKRVRR
ncbi:MAG: hypothetical protein HZB16_03610 [Armatimonadetes bacterium]|nr:hypothetical protein [Armatimonadota bacterium]